MKEEHEKFDLANLDLKSVEKLRDVSPLYKELVNRKSLRVLLGLGGKDMRVPAHQGKTLFYVLQSRGISVRVNLYPNEEHSLSGPNEEHWVRSVVEFFTH